VKTYVVEVERTERDSFALTVPALPGLLILGLSIDEVLERARAAIEFYAAADMHNRPARLEVALTTTRGLSGVTATEQRI
jgi:predicted RNase H-like HicB family nuclease